MFTPTKFPCQVWYLTPALNVREATADSNNSYYLWSDIHFHCTNGKVFHRDSLFATRDEAVAEAQRKLADCEQRVARAIGRFARRKKMVASLLKGGGE